MTTADHGQIADNTAAVHNAEQSNQTTGEALRSSIVHQISGPEGLNKLKSAGTAEKFGKEQIPNTIDTSVGNLFKAQSNAQFNETNAGRGGLGKNEKNEPNDKTPTGTEKGSENTEKTKVYTDFDPAKGDTTDPRQIAEQAAKAIKEGGSLDQVGREVTKLIQDMMKEGKSESEIRKMIGYLNNMTSDQGLKNPDGSSMFVWFALSDVDSGKGGFKVDIIGSPMDKNERQLHPQFYVPRQ